MDDEAVATALSVARSAERLSHWRPRDWPGLAVELLIIKALKANSLRSDQITDFSDLAAGRLNATTGISVNKNVGMGYEDLAVVGESLKTTTATAA